MKKIKNDTHRMTIVLLLCLLVTKVQGQEQVKFSTINEVFALAKKVKITHY